MNLNLNNVKEYLMTANIWHIAGAFVASIFLTFVTGGLGGFISIIILILLGFRIYKSYTKEGKGFDLLFPMVLLHAKQCNGLLTEEQIAELLVWPPEKVEKFLEWLEKEMMVQVSTDRGVNVASFY